MGWAQIFIPMVGGCLPASLQSSDMAGITQRADMRRNPAKSIPNQDPMSWRVKGDQGHALPPGGVMVNGPQ